jgi:hypothetical protein
VSARVVSRMACRIALILAGIDQAPVETVVAHKPGVAAMKGFGLEHPDQKNRATKPCLGGRRFR